MEPGDFEPEFSDEPQIEFGNMKRCRTAGALGDWESGARFLRSREKKTFLGVLVDGKRPEDFTDFLHNFIKVHPVTAYRYMDAAKFPRKYTAAYGLEQMAWLKKITDLTDVDETPEQAIALVLPLENGDEKPFTQMNTDQLEKAYRLIRDEKRPVRRPQRAPDASATDPKLETIKSQVSGALGQLMTAKQIKVKQAANGDYLLDLGAFPVKQCKAVGAALSRIPE